MSPRGVGERIQFNGHPGEDPTAARERMALELRCREAEADLSARERKAIRAAVKRWGKKEPTPDGKLAELLGDDYPTRYPGIVSLVSLRARTKG